MSLQPPPLCWISPKKGKVHMGVDRGGGTGGGGQQKIRGQLPRTAFPEDAMALLDQGHRVRLRDALLGLKQMRDDGLLDDTE